MGNVNVSIREKYTLTIEEAAQYFRIGENKLRKLRDGNLCPEHICQECENSQKYNCYPLNQRPA